MNQSCPVNETADVTNKYQDIIDFAALVNFTESLKSVK